MFKKVGIVVVCHGATLAQAVIELASSMAPQVLMVGCGGLAQNQLGTSFDDVQETIANALDQLGQGGQIVVVTDIGSTTLTVETVLEMNDYTDSVRYADGPLVEGTVAGAVQAQQGADAPQVQRAIEGAASFFTPASMRQSQTEKIPQPEQKPLAGSPRKVQVADPEGMHARPAAVLARLAGSFDAKVTVDGADATSVLSLMALGARQGQTVLVQASGPQASEALEAVCDAIANGCSRL